ncbi:phage tail tape measure protein [Methanobacterium sp.]|uniref:phage tail tape measure protein n=1 Tax=Methanobacterium sp. TaxID=2164 RepID=UPI003157F539
MATTKEYGILVTGDINDIQAKLNTLVGDISKIPDKVIELTANVNDKPVKELDTELDSLDGRVVKTDVNADISDAETDVKKVIEDVKGIPDKKTVKIDADGSEAESEINNLKDMLDDLKQTALEFATGTAAIAGISGLSEQDTEVSNMKKSTSSLSKEMEDVANQVYKVTSADWSTITEAVRYVVGQMGLSGAAAVNMTKEMINFQKAFPWTDTYSLARAISSVMKNMGVDAQTAFNLISLAMQKTQDPGQDLLDTFWEYSNQFARMGWSAQEFTNYLIEGLQEGAFNSDKLGDAFKELTIRVTENRSGFIAIAKQMGFTEAQANSLADAIAKGGPAAKDAVNQINSKFSTLPQSLQDQLGPSLYGSMYEDLRKTIPNSINKALNESVDDTNAAAQQAGEKVGSNTGQGVADGFIQFLRQLGLGPFVDGLSDVLQEAISIVMALIIGKLILSLPQMYTIFKNAGTKVSDIIRTWAWGSDAGNASRGLFQAIEGNIKDTSILGRITSFGSNVVDKIRGWSIFGDEAGKVTIDMVGSVEDGFKMKPSLIQKITQFGYDVVGTVTKVFSFIKIPSIDLGIAKLFGDLPISGIVAIGAKIAGALAVVTMGLDALWNASDYYSEGIVSSLLKITGIEALLNFVGLGDGVKNFEAWADGITGSLQQLVDNLFGSGFGQMVTNFAEGIQNTFRSSIDLSSIGGFFSSLVDLIKAPFVDIANEGLAPWLLRIGGQISDYLAPIGGMVQQRLAGIPQWIASAFNIDWNAIGYNIGNGIGQLTVYFLAGLYTLLSALFALPGQAYTSILNLGTWIYNGLIAIPGQIYAGLTGIYNQFTSFLGWLAGLPGQAQSRINKTGADMQAGINAIPGRVQTGLLSIWGQFTSFLGWLAGLPGKAYAYILNMGQQMYVGIAAIPGQVYNGLLNIWNQFTSFIGWIASLPTQLYNAIVAAWDGFVKGITDKMPEITYWLDKIRGLFPHSPPKWGPLVDIMDWGGNMADAIQQGIDEKFPNLASSLANQLTKLQNIGSNIDLGGSLNLNTILGSLAIPQATLQNMSTPQTTQQVSLQFGDIKLEIKNLDSETSNEEVKQKAQILGKELSSTLSDELKDQITNKGILK